MNTIAGAFSFASSNASLTIFAPSPINICTKCGPASFKNVASVYDAQALAIKVFPVPGGPNKSTPFGGLIPIFLKSSGCYIGKTIASLNS